MTIKPQEGPQWEFLASPADIAIYGGAAGGGKSYALLIEPLRHIHNPKFGGMLFRRTNVQLKVEGGLWDTSADIYPLFAGYGRSQSMTWTFPSGAAISMAGIEHEKDLSNYQGAQIPYIAFDELTHFSERQWWYMFSRSRSTSGVPGYIRAATNPDPDSWVKRFIQWWLNPETGLPIKERAGILRYFVRKNDEIHWAFSKAELLKRFGQKEMPKSVTFIPSNVYDNKILLETDPDYLANLMALPYVEREQLLGGNWNVRPSAGAYFKRHYFGVVKAAPTGGPSVRFWDRAASRKTTNNPDPDATYGMKITRAPDGFFYIEHGLKLYESPAGVNKAMKAIAEQDGVSVKIGFNQDPGSAGVYEAQDTARMLAGFDVRFWPATGDKETRAKPASAQAEAGNIKLVEGEWNEPLLRALESFPIGHDDEVDALSGAFEMLTKGRTILLA